MLLEFWLRDGLFIKTSQIVGSIVIIYLVISFLVRGIRFFRTLLPRDLSVRYGKGSWALVTGASSGIGEAFCDELAQKGFNIILISENSEELSKVSQRILSANPNVRTKVIVADFSNSGMNGFFENIYSQIEGLDISILINNVGIAGGGPFKDQPENQVRDLVVINTLPQAVLTRKLIPKMLTRKKRSCIVFLSSIMGTRPFPYFATYSATKVFADYFARALAEEYPELDILSLRPVYVSTKMTFNKRLSFKTLSAKECVCGITSKLGYESSTAGNWRHVIYTFFRLEITPIWLFKLLSKTAAQKAVLEFKEDIDKIKVKQE